MYLGTADEDVILTIGIIFIEAKGVLGTDVPGIDGAQDTVGARIAISPAPLLADRFHQHGVFRNLHILGPDKKARRQHRYDPNCCKGGQPPLQLLVLGFVFGPSFLFVAVLVNGIHHEQVDSDKYKPAHNECDGQGVVDHAPVRSDRGQVPGAQEMKQDRADDEQKQDDNKNHSFSSSGLFRENLEAPEHRGVPCSRLKTRAGFLPRPTRDKKRPPYKGSFRLH